MSDPGAGLPRPAAGTSRTELEALLQQVRHDLAARDEDPTGAWVEETAVDLAKGAKPGWYLPGPNGGVAFYARRGTLAFGHVHSDGGPAGARRLASELFAHLPPEVRALSLGFTGLAAAEERAVATDLAVTERSTVIERRAMERTLSAADGQPLEGPPTGIDRVPVSAVTVEALSDLDWRGFHGSIDGLLLGGEPTSYRQALEAMLDGRFGRFLGEASTALVEEGPTRLVGLVLTAERSSHRAIVLDLVVDPDRQGRGFGRFLLRWALRALWALGYESVRLWVSSWNERALTLYRATGFHPSLEATIYRWDRPGSAEQPQASR